MIKIRRSNSWTMREERRLVRMFSGSKNEDLLREFPGRTIKAIASRAKILGVRKGTHKPWSATEDKKLREIYPKRPSKKVARQLGRSLESVNGRVSTLGISKDPAYRAEALRACGRAVVMSGKAHRFPKGHVPANKGTRRPGYAPGRMASTQFRKGERAGSAEKKWVPVGTVTFNADGYLRRKIADEPEAIAGKGAHSTNWEFVHRRVWEDAHGPIPKGHRIWWKDGDHANNALENLELLSGKDHMARTTVHNLPAELKEVVVLAGAISRRITYATRRANGQEQAV